MASDEEYQNFLDKANEGSGGVSSKSTGEGKKLKTLDSGVNVPGSLKELEVYYTSDTDEPFEEVGLKFDGGKLDGCTFCLSLTIFLALSILLIYSISISHSFSVSYIQHITDGGTVLATFSKLVNHDDTAEELSVKEFDPNGQYKEVIEAVKKATDGKGKIFRTGTEGARVEYWVVGIAKGGGSVIGMRAKAVES